MEGGNTAYAAAGAAASTEDMMSAIEAISIKDESEEELDDQMSIAGLSFPSLPLPPLWTGSISRKKLSN